MIPNTVTKVNKQSGSYAWACRMWRKCFNISTLNKSSFFPLKEKDLKIFLELMMTAFHHDGVKAL